MLKRLPADNFPDDTETWAFQNYSETSILKRRLLARQWVINGIALLIVVAIVGLMGYVVFLRDDELETTTVVVPHASPTPSPDPLQVLSNDFPAEVVDRQIITLPARIEDTLPTGGRRAYVWSARPGQVWRISVWSTDTLDPVLRLLGPTGLLMEDAVIGDNTAQMLAQFDQESVYALLLEAVSGGSYTVSILPEGG